MLPACWCNFLLINNVSECGLPARSRVRDQDKSRNNKLKITLPGELFDATLVKKTPPKPQIENSPQSNRDHHVASPQTGSRNMLLCHYGPYSEGCFRESLPTVTWSPNRNRKVAETPQEATNKIGKEKTKTNNKAFELNRINSSGSGVK